MTKIHEIAQLLKNQTLTVCQHLFPNGKAEGSHYRIGSVDGDAGRSLAIDLQQGCWIDQSTGEGGDMLTLWQLAHNHSTAKQAAESAAQFLNYHHYPLPQVPDKPAKQEPEKFAPEGTRSASSNPYVLDYFNGRGIGARVLNDYQILADGKLIIMPRYWKGENVGGKVFPAGNKSLMRQVQGSQNHCFGWQACTGKPTLVITEGEIDAMSVYKATRGGFDVVSVPSGASNLKWLSEDADAFSAYREIILWMDNDEAGQKNVSKILDTLGKEKCRSVVSSLKDANEVLTKLGVNAVMRELENSNKASRMGYVTIDPEEASNPEVFLDGAVGLFPKVNFFSGTTTLLAGANGSGKSTLALQIAHIMNSLGIKPFILSPEMPPKFSAQILTRQCTPIAVPNQSLWKDACKYVGENFLLSTVDEQLTPKAALQDFDDAYEAGCRLIILDSITCIKSGRELKDEADFADLLRMWTRAHPDCYMLALAHLRKPNGFGKINRYDIRGASQISDLAGHVWLLERKDPFNQKDQAFYGDHDSKLVVDKNRATGENSMTMLNFAPRQKLFFDRSGMPEYLPADQTNVVRMR